MFLLILTYIYIYILNDYFLYKEYLFKIMLYMSVYTLFIFRRDFRIKDNTALNYCI